MLRTNRVCGFIVLYGFLALSSMGVTTSLFSSESGFELRRRHQGSTAEQGGGGSLHSAPAPSFAPVFNNNNRDALDAHRSNRKSLCNELLQDPCAALGLGYVAGVAVGAAGYVAYVLLNNQNSR